jgi:hypothetical protein
LYGSDSIPEREEEASHEQVERALSILLMGRLKEDQKVQKDQNVQNPIPRTFEEAITLIENVSKSNYNKGL